MHERIYINGKFLAQPLTGVQRFAFETVSALDRLLARNKVPHPFILIAPTIRAENKLELVSIPVIHVASSSLHVWEQITLPARTRGATLLNLAGSAPLLKHDQVCTFHDAAVYEFSSAYSIAFLCWYRLLFGVQARICRGVLTVSEFSCERLKKYLGKTRAPLQVVPNGCDHFESMQADESILSLHGLKPGSYLLAVGSANPSKNFPALLRGFDAMAQKSIRLVVAGGGNAAVFAAEDGGGEGAGVVRTGRITDAQLKALYVHARAFVFPSLYEGFGIPPLEAMACSCPVVASDIAPIVETCGAAALYFDPNDIGSITAALARVCADDGLCERLRRAGKDRAARFTWRGSATALLNALGGLGLRVPCGAPGVP